jgi:hypothetical protein
MNQPEISVVIVSDYAGGGEKFRKEWLDRANCRRLASTRFRHRRRPIPSIFVKLDEIGTRSFLSDWC